MTRGSGVPSQFGLTQPLVSLWFLIEDVNFNKDAQLLMVFNQYSSSRRLKPARSPRSNRSVSPRLIWQPSSATSACCSLHRRSCLSCLPRRRFTKALGKCEHFLLFPFLSCLFVFCFWLFDFCSPVFNFATPRQWDSLGNFSLGPFWMKLRLTYHPVPGSSTFPSTQSTSALRARAARPPLRSPTLRKSCNITRRQTKRVGRTSSRFSSLVGGREQNIEIGIWDESETWTRCASMWRVSLIVVFIPRVQRFSRMWILMGRDRQGWFCSVFFFRVDLRHRWIGWRCRHLEVDEWIWYTMPGEMQERYKSLLYPAGLVTFWRLYILGLQAGDLDTRSYCLQKYLS